MPVAPTHRPPPASFLLPAPEPAHPIPYPSHPPYPPHTLPAPGPLRGRARPSPTDSRLGATRPSGPARSRDPWGQGRRGRRWRRRAAVQGTSRRVGPALKRGPPCYGSFVTGTRFGSARRPLGPVPRRRHPLPRRRGRAAREGAGLLPWAAGRGAGPRTAPLPPLPTPPGGRSADGTLLGVRSRPGLDHPLPPITCVPPGFFPGPGRRTGVHWGDVQWVSEPPLQEGVRPFLRRRSRSGIPPPMSVRTPSVPW